MTLGSIKLLDPAKARTTARELLARVELGQDPAADRRKAIAKANDAPMGEIVDRFLVSVLKLVESFESFVIQGWRFDSL